jgi:hypothetical protein
MVRVRIRPHSLLEEHLYLDFMTCRKCGGLAMHKVRHHYPATWIIRCEVCGAEHEVVTDVRRVFTPEYQKVLSSGDVRQVSRHHRRINRSDEPSRLFDVSQWLEFARGPRNRLEQLCRYLPTPIRVDDLLVEYMLVQCLGEAIKFYPASREYPPRRAFFSRNTYAAYRRNREAYAKQGIIDRLNACRPLDAIEQDLEAQEEMLEGGTEASL